MNKIIGILIGVLCVTMSCEDNTLEDEVQSYCKCLQQNIGDDFGRMECIEQMNALQVKYKNQPRKLEELREETMNCN